MDYKKKATILRVCSSKKGERCSCCPAYGQGDRNCCRNAMRDAATAIIELLERAEKAERERDAIKADLDFYKDGCHHLRIELESAKEGGTWND